jgi:hypothetical protein
MIFCSGRRGKGCLALGGLAGEDHDMSSSCGGMQPLLCTVAFIAAASSALAQAPTAFVGCYRIEVGRWSKPLAEDSAYHKLPTAIRLDTLTAPLGGWIIRPDIAYPTGNRPTHAPRWSVTRDTVTLRWSTGFNSTTIRGVRQPDGEIVGRVDIWHDANPYGNDTPWTSVTARRVACESF